MASMQRITCVAPVADAGVPARAVDAAGVGCAAWRAACALIDVDVAARALKSACDTAGMISHTCVLFRAE